MPPTDAPNVVARQLQFVCRWIVEVVAPLSEEQLRWQPHAAAPSIRFHLFHIARCADGLQNYISQGDGQLWKREGIAARWGLDPAQLGLGENGATVDPEAAERLALPEKAELLAYAERTLEATDRALAAVDDATFGRVVPGWSGESMEIGLLVADSLEHLSRHLGMIEALKGVQGLAGTATI
jgi:hypothetical protein